MTRQSEPKTCEIYISPDERQLLARIARRRGVGRDYLALRGATAVASGARGRPIPQWLGREKRSAPTPPPKPRIPTQPQHCRSCAHLSVWSPGHTPVRFVCAQGVWTYPLLQQSVQTSQHIRLISLACQCYRRLPPRQRLAPHHCRACQHLVVADTVDERYICSKGVWSNPMKPQSVANARRLTRLSASCSFFVPRNGQWLPRSARRAPRDA